MPMVPLSRIDLTNAAAAISRTESTVCEISQFWQNRHLNVQPLGPLKKIRVPG